jgi:hypothetical protein
MKNYFQNSPSKAFAIITLPMLMNGFFNAPAASAKTMIVYAPGIALTPDVRQSDGITPQTYSTPQGLSYWTTDLPILQGDKIKLNVFVATGGGEINNIKVRLDNAKIADISGAPWDTIIDTANLASGYHFVEVWAKGSGDKPQTTTKTWSFYVTRALPARYLVKGMQQVRQAGSTSSTSMENRSETDGDATMPDNLPDYLKNAQSDPQATITLFARQPDAEAALTSGGTVLVSQGIVFVVSAQPDGIAKSFAYAISRNGRSIASSQHPLSFKYERIRIQARTETTPGLRPGIVTLWVWGINGTGQVGIPAKTVLQVP